MKVKYCLILLLAISLVSVAFTFWYMKTRISAVSLPGTVETQPVGPALITTARPSMRIFTLRVPWIGDVEPKASVELTALISGRVEAIEVEDQALVEKGKLVVRLGGLQIEGLRAKLTADVKSLKSQLDLARQTVERLEQSLKAQLTTKDQVAAAQDSQVKLETQLREALLNLGTFENQACISAPMNGTFTKRRVSVGQDVNAGQVVGEIIDASHLRIVASLFPPQGIDLQSKETTIHLGGNQTLTGFVRRVLPWASSTGAVMVWIEGPRIEEQLRPGQTVEGSVVVKVTPETLAVPESAIVYDEEERPYLFVMKNGAYEPRRVQLGLIQDGWVEVLSGLERSQSVVTQGAYELFYRQFNEQFKVQD